ncbi:MAG TPA: hypothetical protein VKU01_20145 [Bryobacteraceae bacterium]|nr:hypothetical protein [Bryobacteraceae bacterium]
MTANDYHFVTQWRVEGTVEEISAVLEDALSLTRWWPTVYLAVREMEPPQADGTGRLIELHTKGWLPYTLKWRFRITETRHPYGFSLRAWGDFDGNGSWTFVQDGRFTNITYDWRIKAEKPLLRYLSFIFKPIFSANHRWAMAQGETSLKRELLRRRVSAQTAAPGHFVPNRTHV